MGIIKFKKLKKQPIFRKMALGTWKNAKDPSIYSFLDIDVGKAMDMIPDYNEKYGITVTPTHLVAKAVSICLAKRPELNAMIRGSHIYLREHVSLFLQVNIPGEKGAEIEKANLGGVVIEKAELLTLFELAKEIDAKVSKVKNHQDKKLTQNFNLLKMIPNFLMGCFLDLISWLNLGLNLNLSFLGIPNDPFGSVMITNVGPLGIENALAPLVPFSRVGAVLTVGMIRPKPWVYEGKLAIRPIMTLGITIDHRLIDGVHGAYLNKEFQKIFNRPDEYLFTDSRIH